MTQETAEAFVQQYFNALFVDRDIESLDTYLDPNYWDDDIGVIGIDHVQNSKEYLKALFEEEPTVGVDVGKVMTQDSTIVAYIKWYTMVGNSKDTLRKGIVIFEMRGERISKRHSYVYVE